MMVVLSPLRLREDDIFIGDNYQSKSEARGLKQGGAQPRRFPCRSSLGTGTVRDFCWTWKEGTVELVVIRNVLGSIS